MNAIPERTKIWIYPIGVLASICTALYLFVFWIDTQSTISIFQLFPQVTPHDASQILNGVGEVIAAILGIVITVASIIVQMAATRYTPRVTEIFFKDKTNIFIMAFFIVSAVFALWTNYSIRSGEGNIAFAPQYGVFVTMSLLTISLLLMPPYFAYVFHFLQPQNIIYRIRTFAEEQYLLQKNHVPQSRTLLRQSLEQLADISLSAISQKDRGVASTATDAISNLAVSYTKGKKNFQTSWFSLDPTILHDPDFVSMTEEARERMMQERYWFEYKSLRQLLMIYREALQQMPDLINQIAIDTRYIGQAAIATNERPTLSLVIKFFNTYMRRALNMRDVPAGYNNLNQYRYLAEELIRSQWTHEVLEIAGYFKYYAQIAHSTGLPFLTETVAFDLCALNEFAYTMKSDIRDQLLKIFLEVDKEAELEPQESALRGVRKAQIKLAVFYLSHHEEELAKKILFDMIAEKRERIRSIRDEFASVQKNEFWEINDRGSMFEFIDPSMREHLRTFFEWFEEAQPASKRFNG